MKTEPDTFSISDLGRVKVEPWTGVRSLMARNFMRQMTVGDEILFYHSSCNPPGVAGLARVAKTGVVDPTQFDPQSPYFDERSTPDKPRWDCVEVEFVRALPRLVSLPELKKQRGLKSMMLFKWSRLSVQPVDKKHFERIVELSSGSEPVAQRRSAVRR